ncbi:replication-relaxation family protein [Actinoplanes sp. NPDC051475]|uniref:replication-relaxation family protein n=1 Tax=Actinoplanes sp. NPDC051475 TaxID=3157225 RepID=UPI00344C7676
MSANSLNPRPDSLDAVRRLTGRDRLVLSWLAEHYVLSTDQIAAALFPTRRAAQSRLTELHRIGAVSRFAFARTETDSGAYRYTLGPLGVQLHPDAYTDPDHPGARPPKTHLERRARIIRSPRLNHLSGTNQFFIDLYAAARRSGGQAELVRWWSEQHATTVFRSATSQIRPDGHGIWRHGTTSVGFFLEHDTGTEDLPRVVKKLTQYERLAHERDVRFPLLLWLPDRRREAHLLRSLAPFQLPLPVATAVHSNDPAGPVWALPGDPGPRLHLHELPGSDSATD